VLGRHVVGRTVPPALAPLFTPWKRFGWVGVDLFFVLSGFLVSGLLFAEHQRRGELRPLRFLGRRGFKIYPAFYLMLLVSWFLVEGRVAPMVFVDEALFIQNYTAQLWGHTWSLAIEEHFYIALALGLWLLARAGRAEPFRHLPRIFVGVAVAALAGRLITFALVRPVWLIHPTHLRIDGLLFGTVLSYAWAYHRERLKAVVGRFRGVIALASAALLVPCAAGTLENSFLLNTVGLTANYLGFGGFLLLAITAGDSERWRRLMRPLATIGFYSYSIYLWHMPLRAMSTVHLAGRIGPGGALLAYLAGSVVFGIVAARIVELPFLRLRDRLLPSRSA
jgi:peptidoglycan/LPS O-acetylase OafA/YrhL